MGTDCKPIDSLLFLFIYFIRRSAVKTVLNVSHSPVCLLISAMFGVNKAKRDNQSVIPTATER